MDQNKIREILNRFRQIDGYVESRSFRWIAVEDMLASRAELKIEIVSNFEKNDGFKIMIGRPYFFEVYERNSKYFRDRGHPGNHELSQFFHQDAARDLYHEVMVELLDQAA